MEMVRISIVVAAVVASLASATAPKVHSVQKTRGTSASFDETWSAVIEAFAANGWAIQNMEKDSGLITTSWMQIPRDSSYADCGGSGIAVVRAREIRFNVFVRRSDPGATVTVNTSFRELRQLDNQQAYARCNSTGKVERLIHDMVATRAGGPPASPAAASKNAPEDTTSEASKPAGRPVRPVPPSAAAGGTGRSYGPDSAVEDAPAGETSSAHSPPDGPMQEGSGSGELEDAAGEEPTAGSGREGTRLRSRSR